MFGRAQVVAVPMFIVMFAAIARSASNSDAPQAEPASAPPPIPVGQPGRQPESVNPLTGLVSVSSANYRPLSLNERWVLYWKQNYLSAGAYAGPVLTAVLLDQASGTPAQWGGGVEGFGRRLASRLGGAILQGSCASLSRWCGFLLVEQEICDLPTDSQAFPLRTNLARTEWRRTGGRVSWVSKANWFLM
jgi:hypothetical protein